MRVLFVLRPGIESRSGGDLTQALFTKLALEEAGHHVDVVGTLSPDPRGYDLAHLFGAFDPEVCEPQISSCERAGVPVALSPIWWDYLDFYGASRGCERILAGNPRRIEARLARLRETDPRRFLRANERRKYARRIALQTALMRRAGVLLPNSEIDAYHYRHDLGLYDRPIVVVHHANDAPVSQTPPGSRRGVLCVGRIEPKKNQAMLLYALRDAGLDLTLIGACYEPEYMTLCRRWMTPRVRYLEEMPREAVLRALGEAAVHVLVGWTETPGLVSMEAAAGGARIVVSNDGTESEYYGEDAGFADPSNPESIREAVRAALALPVRERPDALDRRIAAFTMERVRDRTLKGYGFALAAKR